MGMRISESEALRVGKRFDAVGQIVSVKAMGNQKGYDPEAPLVIRGIANKNMVDRYGEVCSPVGCDTRNFMLNPVLLYNHSYGCPIGRVTMIQPEDDGVHFEAVIGDPSKAPLTQAQQEVRSLVAQGILKAVSIGFIPNKIKQPVFSTNGELSEPAVIEQWELLELSVVAVPCNPESIFDLKNMGLNPQLLIDLAKKLGNATMENTTQKQDTGACKSVEQIAEELAQGSMTVQTLIFSKDKFSAETAKAWAEKHGFKNSDVDAEPADSIRLRQRDPEEFDQETFRTIELTTGVQAVVGKLKNAKQEGAAMEELLKQVLEMLTGLVETVNTLKAKVDEMTKPEDKPADNPPEGEPKEDEEMKALKAEVASLKAQMEKVGKVLEVLVQKQC
jgi:HK97 family phage prohead protease